MLPVLQSGGGALSEARSRRLGKGVPSWAIRSSVTASQTVFPRRCDFRLGSGMVSESESIAQGVRLGCAMGCARKSSTLAAAGEAWSWRRHTDRFALAPCGSFIRSKECCTGGWSSGARPCQTSRQTKRMCSRFWSRRHGTQRTTCPASGECLV